MLIDTHCHLNFEAFKDDLPQVIKRAKDRGVEKIIIPGTDLASSLCAVEIANTYNNCWAAIGIHPHHAQDPTLEINDNLRHQLEELLTKNRVVAVGEIGLDYHTYSKTKYKQPEITNQVKHKQEQLLLMQLELARELHLPVIFHCRDAYREMIQTISNNSRNRENSSPPTGVFHCYGGSKQHLSLLITMGYYIGFDGNITYSTDWQQFVTATPLERLLLETDSPFLSPIPHRGTQNEPAYLSIVAEAVARYKETPFTEVSAQTSKNAQTLFRLV